MYFSGMDLCGHQSLFWIYLSSFLIFFTTQNGSKAQRARLISSCKTSLGTGRCTESEELCQSFGGVIADQISFPSLPKPDSACEKGDECCVLLPLPLEDSCLSCGLTGITETQMSGNEVPRRALPDFDAPRWTPRSLDSTMSEDNDAEMDNEGFSARISKISKPNKWCWQVALTDRNGTIFGSGALLDGQNVVTLAHKVADRRPEDILLVLGASDFLHPIDKTDDAIWFTAPLHVFIHHNFDAQSFANDIAVLRIPLAPCHQKNICPVCINDVPVGSAPTIDRLSECVITGWGPVNSAGFPTGIRETPVKVVDNGKCVKNLNDLGIVGFSVADSMFCTSSVKELKSSNTRPCESDGGAPLVCKDNDDRWYLRGLITLGTDACSFESTLPLLMTDVGMFFNWIKIQTHNLNQPASNNLGIPNRAALIRTYETAWTANTPVSPAIISEQGMPAIRSFDVNSPEKAITNDWNPLQFPFHP